MSFYFDESFWERISEEAEKIIFGFEHQNCRSATYYDKEPAIMITEFWDQDGKRVHDWHPLEKLEEKEVIPKTTKVTIHYKL